MNHGLSRAVGLAVAGLGMAGGLAALNRSLLVDDLPPTLPGAMHDWSWRGIRVRYTTLGSGPVVVLLHGIHVAASSFEFRQLFELLSETHAVYALDWPGFGKSERPDIRYDGQVYADLLTDFLGEVAPEPATVVATSLSASYAIASARRRPERVRRLVLLAPAFRGATGAARRLFGRLLRVPLLGTALFNLLASSVGLRTALRKAYADTAHVDDTLLGQTWATAHQPNARLAPAAFVSGALNLPGVTNGRPLSMPVLVIRGAVSGGGVPATAEELRAISSGLTLETIPNAGSLPHDEAADRVAELLAAQAATSGR